MPADHRVHGDRFPGREPGHVTWLIPHHNQIPDYVSGFRDTIAVRVSAHPGVQALCSAFGGPIVSTSANVFTTVYDHVLVSDSL